MKTFKNIIPIFLLVVLIVVVIMIIIPEKKYVLKFENVVNISTTDYIVKKDYNEKIIELLDELALVKDDGNLNGIYRILNIKDSNGTTELWVYENGKIALKRDDDHYYITDKDVTDKVSEYLRIYDEKYLAKPLFINELNKKYSSLELNADYTIKQQNGDTNLRFIFNRNVIHMKITYIDKVKIEESCHKEGSATVCEYNDVEKVISNQKYEIKESETFDFKFNKDSYKYGLKIEFTDFNGETSVVEVITTSGKLQLSDIYIKEEK